MKNERALSNYNQSAIMKPPSPPSETNQRQPENNT